MNKDKKSDLTDPWLIQRCQTGEFKPESLRKSFEDVMKGHGEES